MRSTGKAGPTMWIMEQPLPIVFIGAVIVAALVGGLLQTGKASLLYAAVLMAALTVGMVVVERLVITPREEVKATLFVIADVLEKNEPSAVVSHISAGRPELREEALRRLGQVEILDVKIKRNLKIEIAARRGIEVAAARFNVVFRLRDRRGLLGEGLHPRFVTVNFLKEEDGQWRVRSYEMEDPRVGI